MAVGFLGIATKCRSVQKGQVYLVFTRLRLIWGWGNRRTYQGPSQSMKILLLSPWQQFLQFLRIFSSGRQLYLFRPEVVHNFPRFP